MSSAPHPVRSQRVPLAAVSRVLRRLTLRAPDGRVLMAAGIVGILPTALGLVRLVDGLVSRQISDLLAWCTLLVGGLVVAATLALLHTSDRERYRIRPLLLILVLASASVALHQILLDEELLRSRQLVASKVDNLRTELATRLEQTSKAMKRFGARLEYLGIGDKRFVELDATSYLQQLPILRRLGLIDADYRVTWSFPKAIAGQVLRFDQSVDAVRKEALDETSRTREPSLSRSIALRSGEEGFILPVALHHRDRAAGYVYATVSARRLFEHLYSAAEFEVSVREGDRRVYFSDAPAAVTRDFAATTTLRRSLATIEITATPTLRLISRDRSRLPELVLFGGLLVSLLTGLFAQAVAFSRRSEQSRLEEEQVFASRLNVALKSAEIAVWSLDLRTGFIWRSQNHDELYGYPAPLPDWSAERFYERVHPDDRARLRRYEREDMLAGEGHSVEFRIIRADDRSTRWLSIGSRVLKRDDRGAQQIIGVLRDVTREREQAARHLAMLEWQKAILRATHYSVISTDPDGVIQTFNTAAERLLGYRAEELIGKLTPAVIHDPTEVAIHAGVVSLQLGQDVEPGFEAIVVKARTTGQTDENEWTYVRKDGHRIPMSLAVTVLRDAAGAVTGYLGIGIDLTERKREQRELRIAHERLERVIDATGEGVWERDFASKQVQYMDSRCKINFGLDPDEHPDYDRVAGQIEPDDRARLAAEVERHIAERSPRFELEFRLRLPHPGAPRKWVRTKGKVRTKDGKPERLVATVSDITREVIARQQLEEALERAEAGTLAKSAFLASMSHEIRTPLNGVIGITDLLLDTRLDLEQQKYATIVQQSGMALLALINDVLDFSKIEAGMVELERTGFQVSPLVEGQGNILVSKALEKRISLMTFISPSLPSQVLGDPGRLGQVLLNLIGNAIKFTHQGGVTVRVTPATGDLVRFEVEDTGIGIPASAISKLFRPFTQVDGSISRRYGGTGLGLSICKHLVEAMGGRIGVESRETRGSTFWFEVPLPDTRDARDAAAEPSKLASLRDVRALIVDDDLIAQDVVHRYLESWRMRDGRVSRLAAAIAILRDAIAQDDPYRVAIVGLGRDPGEGLDLGAAIHATLGGQAPKLIVMSEFGRAIEPARLEAMRVRHVLEKPVSQSALFDAIASAHFGHDPVERGTVAAIHAVQAAAQGLQAAGTRPLRVLVADDVAVNQLLTVKLLESLGYGAQAAANGLEVLAAIALAPYDLILMDCQMPELDGFETTARIRQLPGFALSRIPIIALTANAMSGDDQKCLDAGMNDYLSKPLRKELLRAMLERWLGATSTSKSA